MKQLSGLDAAFVSLEDGRMPMHIGGLLVYDPSTAPGGRLSFADLRDAFADRIGRTASFRNRLVRVPLDVDRPWWVADRPVDLDYHLSHLALPAPADWAELCDQVGRFLSRPLDLSRPPWEFLCIEGLDGVEGLPKGAFALAMKMHHAAIDGVAGLEMVSALHDRSPVPRPVTPEQHPGLESASGADLLVRALPRALRQPWRLLGLAGGLAPAVSRWLMSPLMDAEPATPVPATVFNGSVGDHRTLGAVRFELEDVKKIKNAVPGATVNDVVLALIGGALRRHLADGSQLPEESLIAAMPISVRSQEDGASGGNQLAVATVALRTDVEDPLDRVRLVHEASTSKKSVRDGEAAGRLIEVADAIPAGLMGLAGRVIGQLQLAKKVTLVNTVVTNVPGPSAPIYLAGAQMLDVYGFALVADGMGLVNLSFSYRGGLTVGFQAGSTMLPDRERYEECLRWSFAELIEAAGHTTARGGARAGADVRAAKKG